MCLLSVLVKKGYTDEQIDALYSGDQAKINEAFCGEMAWYNPDDGNLYSIYWMSDHTAEDYSEVGIPKEEIGRIYNAAIDSNTYAYVKLAESASEAVEKYLAE